MENEKLLILVLMHSIRKALMIVITITTTTGNFSLNRKAITFSFSLELFYKKGQSENIQ